MPLVTVAIPTKNSAAYLARALESIRDQTYANCEVLVVDNYSIDSTESIARSYRATFLQQGPERSAQLNLALSTAAGKYFYRIDSDFVVDSGLIAECVALCEAGGKDAIATRVVAADGGTFWHAVKRFERAMYFDDSLIVGARFVRTDMLRTIKGFDENLTAGEDYDLHNRLVALGARMGFCKSTETHLGEEDSLGDVWRKSYYYGRSIFGYIKKHPGRSAAQLSPVRLAYFRHWKSFLKHPILGAGLLVYIVTKYAAAGLGAVLSLNSR